MGAGQLVVIDSEVHDRVGVGDQRFDLQIGERITMFGGTDFEIVGIVADVRQRSPDQPSGAEVYFLLHQVPFWETMFVTVTSDGTPPSADVLRAAVWEVRSSMPVVNVRSMNDVMARASGRTRLFTGALFAFGTLALMLAAIGVYGVTSEALASREREFGIRIALGARPGSLIAGALAHNLKFVVLASLIGVAAAALASRSLQGMLYGVSALDPITYLAVPAFLAVTGTLAAYLPARRAARVDPNRSLRGR